jgi:hypothetical protein
MNEHPGIPSLVLIPGQAERDYAALYGIATAYADSGLLVSSVGREDDRIEFSFPAIVCSSFAIELFLKFFLVLERIESGTEAQASKKEHKLTQLWRRISPQRQALIAGMYRNGSAVPMEQVGERQIELFVTALGHVGEQPFVTWRYAHELTKITHMSHAMVSEVVEAFRHAATHVMRKNTQVGNRSAQREAENVSTVINEADQARSLSAPSRVTRRSGVDLLLVAPVSPMVLGCDSVFRRIPANVEPKQILFLDGIRHSVETLDLTYGRIRETLTHWALNPPSSIELSDSLARVFVDAWAFVYAVDRFRVMYLGMPGIQLEREDPQAPTLQEATQEFRLLRLAADRLAKNSNASVSAETGAFGRLDWLTGLQIEPELRAFHCTLRPGALNRHPTQCEEPIISTLEWPTDAIQLSLGNCKANLSAVRTHIARRFRSMEAQLDPIFQCAQQEKVGVLNDLFMRRSVKTPP